MGDKDQDPEKAEAEHARPGSPDPVPLEEAVGALIRVKEPEKKKPRKPQARERKKRNVDPRG